MLGAVLEALGTYHSGWGGSTKNSDQESKEVKREKGANQEAVKAWKNLFRFNSTNLWEMVIMVFIDRVVFFPRRHGN